MSYLVRNTYYLIGKGAEDRARQLVRVRKSVTKPIRIVRSFRWFVELSEEGIDLRPMFPKFKGLKCVTISNHERSPGEFLLGGTAFDHGWVEWCRKLEPVREGEPVKSGEGHA